MSSLIHTIQPGYVVPGFFTDENIHIVQKLITDTIAQTYRDKKVIVPKPHIVRIMQYIQEERPETVAKMNQRVIIYIVRTFLNFAEETERYNMWSYFRWNTGGLQYDPITKIKPFDTPKLNERSRGFRFHFTY